MWPATPRPPPLPTGRALVRRASGDMAGSPRAACPLAQPYGGSSISDDARRARSGANSRSTATRWNVTFSRTPRRSLWRRYPSLTSRASATNDRFPDKPALRVRQGVNAVKTVLFQAATELLRAAGAVPARLALRRRRRRRAPCGDDIGAHRSGRPRSRPEAGAQEPRRGVGTQDDCRTGSVDRGRKRPRPSRAWVREWPEAPTQKNLVGVVERLQAIRNLGVGADREQRIYRARATRQSRGKPPF